MAAPASELGWVVHFAPVVVRFTPLSPISQWGKAQMPQILIRSVQIVQNHAHILLMTSLELCICDPRKGHLRSNNDIMRSMYTRLQTVWSLPGPSRQANKGHSPRFHRRPNGPGRLADKVVQPTTQSAEGCTFLLITFDCNEIETWGRF